ncbi:MAG: Trp family transcriptional regulator [Patescibacteria group bacterium]
MKVRAKELSEKARMSILDALYTAASSVKGRAAMKLFLRDLLTESERIMLGRRILIARRLIAHERHDEIARDMRVGFDTIYRVHRWLEDQLPGYEDAIAGLEREYKKRGEKHLYATSAIFRLKKKYPIHFLLFPWPKRRKY